MNLFISSLLSGATLLLAELVGSRWSPSTDKAVCITASFSMSSIMPWASTTSKPGAIVTSTWRSTGRTSLLIWPTTSRNKTPTTKTLHMTTAPSCTMEEQPLHPGRAGNHHSHSWWDGGNRTEAGNVRHRHPEDQQDLWMLKIRKMNSNDGLCFLVF